MALTSAALAASASSAPALSADVSHAARYALHADHAASTVTAETPVWIRRAFAVAHLSAAYASSSSAALSRLGSFCSNEPRSSLVSVAAVSATCRRVLPASVASVCTRLVLPDAAGPATIVIQPSAQQCAAASNAGSWPRKRPKESWSPAPTDFAFDAPKGKHASPTCRAPSRKDTAGGGLARGDRPNDPAKSSTHSTRSPAVRSLCEKRVSNVASTARSKSPWCIVAALPVRSHHRSKSRRLNSHGAPALAKVPPTVLEASASEPTKWTIRSMTSVGTAG